MPKIGYNINLSAIDNNALPDATRARADMHVLMTTPPGGVNRTQDVQQIIQWRDALAPADIVWRTYNPMEGNWQQYPDAVTQVGLWRVEGHPEIIRDDPVNEPNIGDDSAYVKRCVALLNEANEHGFRVAIGAFSVGTPHESKINDGTYDDLIRAVVEGGHYFSVHEYAPGVPGAGDVFGYEVLHQTDTIKDMLKDELWPIGEYWLLRRSDRFVLRARELGLADPNIIITESWCDYIPDAQKQIEVLEILYGIDKYDKKLRGVQAWSHYYGVVGLNPDMLTEYVANKVYNVPWVKGVALFAINNLWDTPQGHNWGNPQYDTFRRISLPDINAKLKDGPMDTPQEIPMKQGTISSSHQNGSNVRNKPADNGEVVASFTSISGLVSEEPTPGIDGIYKWWRVDSDAVTGWVADTQYISTSFLPVDEEPPQDDDSGDDMPDIEQLVNDAIEKRLLELFATELVDLQLGFTTSLPKALRAPLGDMLFELSKVIKSIAFRVKGTPTLEEVARVGYSWDEGDKEKSA